MGILVCVYYTYPVAHIASGGIARARYNYICVSSSLYRYYKYHVAYIATVLLVFGILVYVYYIYYCKYHVAYIAPVLLVFDILVYVYLISWVCNICIPLGTILILYIVSV